VGCHNCGILALGLEQLRGPTVQGCAPGDGEPMSHCLADKGICEGERESVVEQAIEVLPEAG
jgi:hypothetical protein